MSPYKTPCFDCGVDVTPRTRFRRRARMGRFEIYMVTDEVWAAAGGPAETMDFFLCVGCLEERLGRRLTPADFPTDVGLNDDAPVDSPRLVDRKGTGRRVGPTWDIALELVLDFDREIEAVAALLEIDGESLGQQAEQFRRVLG